MFQVEEIEIDKIDVGEFATRERYDDDTINELTTSINRIGILNPLICRREGDRIVLVAGHRRYTAAKIIGLLRVPVFFQDTDKAKASEIAFAENMFRKDLTPIEMAAAIHDTLESKAMTPDELCRALKRSLQWLKQQLNILTWPTDVQQAVHEGWLSSSAAENIALITDDVYRNFILEHIHRSGATARLTASYLQGFLAMQPPEEAVNLPPADGEAPQSPLAPQALCICCTRLMRSDMMCYVPLCGACINVITKMNADQRS